MSGDKCVGCWEEEIPEGDRVRKCTHSNLHWMCTGCVLRCTSPVCATCRQPLEVTEEISLCDKRGFCLEDGDTSYCGDCWQPMTN